jgi:hypothetical protein
MRLRSITNPTLARSLVRAIPEYRLRELVVELLLGGAPVLASTDMPRSAERRRGRPPGRRPKRSRGRKVKAAGPRQRSPEQREHDVMMKRQRRAERAADRLAAAGEGAPTVGTPEERREAALVRAKRSAAAELAKSRKRHRMTVEAAKAATEQVTRSNGEENSPGNGSGSAECPPAPATGAQAPTPADFWQHAARLEPKRPWKFVADEFAINPQQALDCYRLSRLPPGVSLAAVPQFLALEP